MQNKLYSEPWYLLLSNRISEAETAFLNLSDEPERLRGLGWIAYLADDVPALMRTWGRLPEVAPDHWSAAVAAQIMLSRGLSQARFQAAAANPDISRELSWLVRDLEPTGRTWRWRAHLLGRWHGIQPRRDPFLCAVSQLGSFDVEEEDLTAVTAVYSHAPRNVWLLCSHHGCISIWLNGLGVFSRMCFGALFPKKFGYRVSVHLQAGWNTLQVSTRNDFRLAFTDDSDAILNLTTRPVHASLGEMTPVDSSPTTPWSVECIDLDSPDAPLWKSLCFRNQRDAVGAFEALVDLSAQFPDSGLLAWLCLESLAEPNSSGSRRYLNIARQSPECYPAKLQAVEKDCLEELSFLASERPDHARTWERLYYAQSRANVEERHSTLSHLATLPGGRVLALRQYRWLGQQAEAEALFQRIQRDCSDEIQRLSNQLCHLDPRNIPFSPESLDVALLPAALVLAEALARKDPEGGYWTYEFVADLLRCAQDFPRAVCFYRQSCRYAPLDANKRVRLAQAYEEAGDEERALRTYRQALRLNPSKIYLRVKLQECPSPESLLPTVPFFPPWPTIGEPTVLHVHMVGFFDVCDDTCSADETLLLDFCEMILPDGARLGYYHAVYRLAGHGIFSCTYPVRQRDCWGTLITSKVYRADGQVWDTRQLRQGSWATYHDCRPGDLFEVYWRLESPDPGTFARKRDLGMGERSRFSLITPQSLAIEANIHAHETLSADGNWKVLSWPSQDHELSVRARPLET